MDLPAWPVLDVERDSPTFAVLHLASQMLGKIRVANASWSTPRCSRGPTGETLPTAAGDGRTFTLVLDLCRHAIVLWVSDQAREELPLNAASIAALHKRLVALLDRNGLPSRFHGTPNEVDGAVPFADDRAPRDYDRNSADRLREALAAMMPVFERFRAGFAGKASPVHFWWGAFDLAVTRFSGREAPQHPGGLPGLPDRITREAFSHEVSSAGFWPGGVLAVEPMFYSYAYPEPDRFPRRAIGPAQARFDEALGEFTLTYDAVRRAADPAAALTQFLESTYAAAADLAKWDRPALEREPVAP